MDGLKLLAIEAKTFELRVVEEGKSLELITTERGRGFLQRTLLGQKSSCGCFWCLVKLMITQYYQNFWRHFNEGNKTFLVEKGENQNGAFLPITELLLCGWRYYIFVPFGPNGRRWFQFGSALDSLLFGQHSN